MGPWRQVTDLERPAPGQAPLDQYSTLVVPGWGLASVFKGGPG